MRIVVFGLGKTGTTALFFKLKQAMGKDTHCLFEPRSFVAPPAPSNGLLAKVLLGYNRDVDPSGFLSFDRKLLLTRDPRDTLISRVLYDIFNEPTICADDQKVSTFVNLLRRKEADPACTPLKNIIDVFDGMSGRAVLPRATHDPGIALAFQRDHKDVFAYRYEDLVRAHYSPLAPYLGFALDGETRRCPRNSCESCGRSRRKLAPLADRNRRRVLQAVVCALPGVQRLFRGLEPGAGAQNSTGALFGLRSAPRPRTPEYSRLVKDAESRFTAAVGSH